MAASPLLNRLLGLVLDPFHVFGFLLLLALHGLFLAAALHFFPGSVFLLVCLGLFWFYVFGVLLLRFVPTKPFLITRKFFSDRPWIGMAGGIILTVLLVAYVVYCGWGNRAQLSSFGTLFLILIFSVIVSDNPGRIRWRPVIWGIVLQYAIAMLILRWEVGRDSISFVVNKIVAFLSFTLVGTKFAFGFVPDPPAICGLDAPFSFTSLPIIVFVTAISSVAYFYGIVQWILRRVGVVIQATMGTTAAESLNAGASSFMGPTEAAALMEYSLSTMTQSEIVATIAVGYSMISGSLFAVYISYGACAPLLLAANVMSAPATLAISKIVSPEIHRSRQADMSTFRFPPCTEKSSLEALSRGAISAVFVVLAIIANLVVYLAGLAFVNSAIGYLAGLVGFEGVTFELVIGYLFFPVALVIGASDEADWSKNVNETLRVSQLIGTKTVLNEFIAFQNMQGMLLRREISGRGQLIAVFALCGYSNPSQIGAQIAQFSAMCPAKKKNFVAAATKGLLIGALACLMTACVAGSLIDNSMGCRPNDPSQNCLDLNEVVDYFKNRTMLAR